ncbi:hypothetical protein BDR07DRAFT_1415504 [Suillus spraguei]|nr:hypothetical protein BDR07DRAFT_1415504 [Suillus spraguei]
MQRVKYSTVQWIPTMIWLTFSTEHVRNTVITNKQGQVIYKTDTPFRLVRAHTATIQKIKPNNDQFNVLEEIEWHTFNSSKFRAGGTKIEMEEFIPK